MRLLVIAVGRLKDGPERELVARYDVRTRALARKLGFSGPDILELPESRARRDEDRRAEEGRAILAAVPGAYLVALDERGTAWSSEAFAARLAARRDEGQRTFAFVIGGADGLDRSLIKSAAETLCFGAATFPHQIVRILLAEQIYRGMTILSGHPYHRGS